MLPSPARIFSAKTFVRENACVIPTSSAYCTATPSPALAQNATSYCSNRFALRAGTYDPTESHRAPHKSSITGSTFVSSIKAFRAYRKPIPRGPRRYLRPVPTRKSHRVAATSTTTCPALCVASRRNGTLNLFVTSPIASAGFTKPPLVGMCVTDTSFTFPFPFLLASTCSILSSAWTSSCPFSSLGAVSITTPFSFEACR
mmetsp:Transcript_640/g.2166  ORF Transcript_640/g.2166 Transcript_640/m.2166 type:complete len:201 (-) Transcript_640:584-1186(-)